MFIKHPCVKKHAFLTYLVVGTYQNSFSDKNMELIGFKL